MIEWKRQDTMTLKERNILKENFLKMIINDSNRKWKYVNINNQQSEYMISNDGILASLRICRYMKCSLNSSGYYSTIITVNNKRINVDIHRLVATAFIPNPENKSQVNHINGNKLINNDWNLEWTSQKENIHHAIDIGLRKSKPIRKYTKTQIHEVCMLLEKGKSNKDISDKTGVSKQVIKRIKSGKSWKKISKKYNIFPNSNFQSLNTIEEQGSTTIESISDIEEEFIFSWEI